MKILLVDDDEISLTLLESILAQAGYEVLPATDGLKGLRRFIESAPELVITDIQMPGMDGLQLLQAIRERCARTIVIMNTALGSEEYAVQALRERANDYLSKPVNAPALLGLMRKYAAAIEAEQRDRQVSSYIERREMAMTIDNCLELAPDVSSMMADQAAGVLSGDDLPMIRMALLELITNAIEHGNLGISKATKTALLQNGNDYMAYLRQRMSDPELGRRRVRIQSRIERTLCEWVITDEGKGFDWRELPREFTPEILFATHGRGVLLSRLQFDEMEYLGTGNIVRVRKRPGRAVMERTGNQSGSPMAACEHPLKNPIDNSAPGRDYGARERL